MVRDFLLAALVVTNLAAASQPVVLSPRTEAQRAALSSREPECLYSGRKFAGKSWVVVVKAFRYATKYSNSRCLVAREERRSMDNTTIDVARKVLPGAIWSRYWHEGKSRFQFANGSVIDFLGLDEPDRMQGSRYGFVGVDQAEQLSFRQYEMINSCVGQDGMPWHQLMLAVNPDTPAHWAYRIYRPDEGSGLRENNGETFARVVRVGRQDLLDMMPASYKSRLDRLSGVRYRQLVLGEWCAHEAQVYGYCWDATTMSGQPVPESWKAWGNYPPPDWDRVRGIDFGFDHAAVTLWLALEPGSEKVYLYRQHYRSGLSPRQNALKCVEIEQRELQALRDAVPDRWVAQIMKPYLDELNVVESWSDTDRGERATYDECGIWSQAANKDVVAGIGAVADLMMAGNFVTVVGNLDERDERLAGLELPTCLEEEIPLYHRPGGDDEGVGRKEIPVKEHDHACDALRYPIFSRAQARKAKVYA